METIASGGVEQRRLLLAKWFDPNQYKLKIICTNAIGAIPEELEKFGIEVIQVGDFKHPFHISKHKKVLKIINSFRPHIFHGATFEGIAMAAIGGNIGKVPILILEETSDPQNRSSKANFLLRQFVKFSDCIVAISPNVKNYLINKAKVPFQKIRLIINGVQIPRQVLSEELNVIKNQHSLKNKDFVIGFVGRLYDDHKRVSDLIIAISLIKVPCIKLLIVGDGKDRDKLEKLIEELSVQNKVILVGNQSDPSSFYKIMDVFCVPSSREGFGLVAAEAMLHHLPVVATKVGGLQDVVVDGETGFLVPPLNPKALSEKLQILIDNPELRTRMGNAGYQRAMQHYTADRYCQEVENLYLTLLKQKGILPN